MTDLPTLEAEAQNLLRLLTGDGYEPNHECHNPVCRALARIRDLVPSSNGRAHD